MILKNGKRIDGCTDTLPVGTVQPFLGLTPPLGYLVCQGQLISKVEYPELYQICGSTFGTETDTHFYLPDLRGKTIAGYDSSDSTMNTIGKLLGNKIHTHTTSNHTLTIDEMPTHYHDIVGSYNSNAGLNLATSNNGDGTTGYMSYSPVHPTGGSQPHNHGDTGETTNFQPTVTMNWIVKAAMLIPEYFVVENTLTSTSTSNALSAAQGKILNNKFNNYLPIGGTAKFAEALPGFDYFENNEQSWGNQIGECLYRADSPSGGSIALRGDNPNEGQLSLIIDGFFYQQEGNWRCLDVSDLGNYAFYKFPQFAIDSSTPVVSHSLQITGKGRPIFVSITGDLNTFSEGGSWVRITLKRGNAVLATQIAQGGSLSQNIPFAINYLDRVGAGDYTYSVHFERGGNDSTFGEENGYQTPNFLIYEI